MNSESLEDSTDDGAVASRTDQPVAVRTESCSGTASPSFWRFPVVRFAGPANSGQAIAVYPDHILIGRRRSRSTITARMLTCQCELELATALNRVVRIKFAEISKVVEYTNGSPGPDRTPVAGAVSRFVIQVAKSRRQKLVLPYSQCHGLRDALEAGLGERFEVRRYVAGRAIRVSIGLLMLVFGMLIGPAGAMSLLMTPRSSEQMPASSMILGAVMSLTGFGSMAGGVFIALTRPRGRTVAKSSLSETTTDTASAKVSLPNSGVESHEAKRIRKPLRSAKLGWFIKTLGLLWWLALLSPPVDAFYQRLTSSNPPIIVSNLIWIGLMSPTVLLLHAGYRMSQLDPTRHSKAQSKEPSPVLFLRPFDDDQTLTLQPTGWTASATGVRDSS